VVNLQQLLFTETERHSKFGCSLCKIRWEKHNTSFVKVVEGSEIYNFPIHHLVHFCSDLGENDAQSCLVGISSAELQPRRDAPERECTRCVPARAATRQGRPLGVRAHGPCPEASPSPGHAHTEAIRFSCPPWPRRRSTRRSIPIPLPAWASRSTPGRSTHGFNVGRALTAKQGPPSSPPPIKPARLWLVRRLTARRRRQWRKPRQARAPAGYTPNRGSLHFPGTYSSSPTLPSRRRDPYLTGAGAPAVGTGWRRGTPLSGALPPPIPV
jgi:hypothetical protein